MELEPVGIEQQIVFLKLLQRRNGKKDEMVYTTAAKKDKPETRCYQAANLSSCRQHVVTFFERCASPSVSALR